jgi:two-component system nitrate/nitrite response regulator NarL
MSVTAISPFERTRGGNEAPRTPLASRERSGSLPSPTPRSPRGSQRGSGDVGFEHGCEPSPRIVIADHHAGSRFGIRLALERAGFVVVAEAATGEDAVALALAWAPDACLVDVDIAGGGIATAWGISARVPGTAILMLGTAADEDDFLAAITAGASGYLLKTMDPERLPVAVRAVLAGEAAIPRAFGRRLVEEIRQRGSAAPPYVRGGAIRLTPRESQIVHLMEDMPTREIAARLGISEVTVRRHVSAALHKLKAPDRQAAVRLLRRARTTGGRRFLR